MTIICSVDLLKKVVDAYSDFKGTKTDWYTGIQKGEFRKHCIERWGFHIYNQTNHLKQNYAHWAMDIRDEQKYTLFLLRY